MRERSKATSAPTGRAFSMPRSRRTSRKASIALRPSARFSFTRSSSAGVARRSIGRSAGSRGERSTSWLPVTTRAISGPREVLQITRSSHASSSPFGSKLYTFPPGEKTTFTAQAMRPLPEPVWAGSLCSRLLGPGDRPQTVEERLEREGRRNCQLQRSARVARGLEAARGKCFATVCSIFYQLLAVVRVYQRPVGSERRSEQIAVPGDERLDGRARLLDLGGACPAFGQRLALAPHP